jgi:hypothetical protein
MAPSPLDQLFNLVAVRSVGLQRDHSVPPDRLPLTALIAARRLDLVARGVSIRHTEGDVTVAVPRS